MAEVTAKRAIAATVYTVVGERMTERRDALAAEEPLEIRLAFGPLSARENKSVAVTMRTPGDDFELALGFLWTEGILASPADAAQVRHRGVPETGAESFIVQVDLTPGVAVEIDRLERHFYTTSSCGVCGKASLDAVQVALRYDLTADVSRFSPHIIHHLPAALREAQSVFDQTGGLHAAALFDAEGNLIALREDVGRHNAVDKVIGAQLRAGALPLAGKLLLVSGRASFELVQKAAMAGIPLLAAIGAPSSLAVQLAQEVGMTLLGFVRETRFNIYAGTERIRGGNQNDKD